MNQRDERRRKNRRSSQSLFYDAISDRRRPGYERRGRTRVRPMPAEMVGRVLQGDTSTRRFEESGSE